MSSSLRNRNLFLWLCFAQPPPHVILYHLFFICKESQEF
nr:MAG TPA_asm: hypothetical protein [Caudoviricetes sp.]